MKRFYLLFLLSILSLNLFCQVHWTKHPDNPVLTPGSIGEWEEEFVEPGPVIYFDDIYHMWYTGSWSNARIGHATSPDGISWTKDTNNPVLDAGPEGDWDETWVIVGGVLVIDSIFHMWYTGKFGSDPDINFRIGHATSPDGVIWTKDTINNPVLDLGSEGEWDDTFIYCGSVLYDSSEYHMWYTGYDTTPVRIGHATSPDGITWTKDPQNPVMTSEQTWDGPIVYSPRVLFNGTTYHMWYSGGHTGRSLIGYATSEDGSVWTRYGNPVLRNGPTGSWDSKFVSRPTVLDSAGVKYKMWYRGGDIDETGSIGYAESDTCSDIIRPVLVAEDTLYQPGLIDVTSSKDGIIYLVPNGMYYTLEAIREATIDSVAAIANTPVQISLVGQPNGYIRLFARDNRNNISDVHRITILGVGTFESRAESSVSIYPNPATAMVNIQTNKPGEFAIVIESLNGKEINNSRFNGNTHQIDLSSFQNGVYLITIRSKDFVITKKIFKL